MNNNPENSRSRKKHGAVEHRQQSKQGAGEKTGGKVRQQKAPALSRFLGRFGDCRHGRYLGLRFSEIFGRARVNGNRLTPGVW